MHVQSWVLDPCLDAVQPHLSQLFEGSQCSHVVGCVHCVAIAMTDLGWISGQGHQRQILLVVTLKRIILL